MLAGIGNWIGERKEASIHLSRQRRRAFRLLPTDLDAIDDQYQDGH